MTAWTTAETDVVVWSATPSTETTFGSLSCTDITIDTTGDSDIKLGADVSGYNYIAINGGSPSDISGMVAGGPGDDNLYIKSKADTFFYPLGSIQIWPAYDASTLSSNRSYIYAESADDTRGGSSYSTSGLTSYLAVNPLATGTLKTGISGIAALAGIAATTGGDLNGVTGLAIANVSNGGTDTGAGAAGTLYGAGLTGQALSGAANYLVVSGGEANAWIATGGSAKHRWGWSISGIGDVRGATSDAALEIGASVLPWGTHGILFSNYHSLAPVHTTGKILGTDGASVTVTDFADFHTYTFTGDILYFSNFRVTGAGDISGNSVMTNTVTVANLPAAASGNKGMRMMVSNATATTFWSIVAGSGANIVPVTSDGTNWRIG